MFFNRKNSPSDASRQMLGLVQRLNLGPKGNQARIITFIASRPREGTSTVARAYAHALALQSKQKVLLIDAGPQPQRRFWQHPHASLGIIDAVAAELSPADAIQTTDQKFFNAHWVCNEDNHSLATQMIRDENLWNSLLETYGTIVLDAPSLQASYDGVILATQSKATLLVIEAEKTPQAVVQKLKETLHAANVSIVGVIMNKRRFYIPESVYKRL